MRESKNSGYIEPVTVSKSCALAVTKVGYIKLNFSLPSILIYQEWTIIVASSITRQYSSVLIGII